MWVCRPPAPAPIDTIAASCSLSHCDAAALFNMRPESPATSRGDTVTFGDADCAKSVSHALMMYNHGLGDVMVRW